MYITFHAVPFGQRGGTFGSSEIQDVRVSDCPDSPCKLRKGNDATIEFDFIPGIYKNTKSFPLYSYRPNVINVMQKVTLNLPKRVCLFCLSKHFIIYNLYYACSQTFFHIHRFFFLLINSRESKSPFVYQTLHTVILRDEELF